MTTPRIKLAELAALQAHEGQMYGIFPYEKHLRDVDRLGEMFGFDENMRVSLWLHDTIEDTRLRYAKILKAFGKDVAELVYAVTDELGRNRRERHEKTYPKIIAAGWRAIGIKLVDRIANVEHSLNDDHELFEMYRREYPEFAQALYNDDHKELKPVWDYLHCLMQNVASA
jgi:guanosine-3',5'-bis(diphosphate) 3'-pyrophosphohydrolase